MKHFFTSRTLALCLLVLPFCSHSCQSANNYTQESIRKQQHWAKENLPKPQSLGDRQLLRQATEAIASSCHETEYTNIIKEASSRFSLPDLAEYAVIRAELSVDTCDHKAARCIRQMIQYADNKGESFLYESAYLRFILTNIIYQLDSCRAVQREAAQYATMLYQQSPSPENKELYLAGQFYSLFQESDFENPTNMLPMIQILQEMELFYQSFQPTTLKYYIYSDIGSYISTCLYTYTDYNSYLDDYVTTNNAMNGIFDICNDTLKCFSSDAEIVVETNYFWKEAMKTAQTVLHKFHPDYIALLNDYVNRNFIVESNVNDIIEYLLDICMFQSEYNGHDSPVAVISRQIVRTAYAKYEMPDCPYPYTESDKDIMQTYFNGFDGADILLNFLLGELWNHYDDPALSKQLSREITQLAYQYYPDKPLNRLSCRFHEIMLQRQGYFGYENALFNIIFDFETICKNNPSWDACYIGKELSNNISELFSDYYNTLRVQRTILRMIEQLVGKSEMIFITEYFAYCRYSFSALPSIPQTLNGELNGDKLFDDLVKTAENTSFYSQSCMLAAEYQSMQGNLQKAKQLLNLAYNNILDSQKSQDDAFHRGQQMLCMRGLINIMIQENAPTKDIDKQIKKLSDLYYQYPNQMQADVCMILFDYYSSNQQWAEAEDVIQTALSHYDYVGSSILDGFYIQLLQKLILIYQNIYTDLDKAQQLTERLEKDIDNIKDLGNYDTYIGLLKMLTDLDQTKSQNIVLRFRNVRLYYEKAKEYYLASGKNDNVLYTVVLDSYSKVNTLLITEKLKAQNNSEWQNLSLEAQKNILPDLKKMKRRYQQLFPDNYKQSEYYITIVANIAMVYDIIGDYRNAETSIKQLAELFSYGSEMLWLFHYYMQGDTENALIHWQKLFRDDTGNKMMVQYNNNFKRLISVGKCVDAIYEQKWEEALPYAEQYYEATQEYIKQNMDFFTQAEVENFLQQNGVGGAYLQALLPYINKPELAETAYNINLQQKGLLLRRNDRIRKAVEASDNPQLIAALDTLQLLQHQLQSVNLDNIMVSIDKNVVQTEEKIAQLERYIARETSQMAERNQPIPTWEDVKLNLKKGEAAVEYVVFNDIAYALLITNSSKHPQYVQLLSIDEMNAIRSVLADTTLSYRTKTKILYEGESKLYQLLWQPIEKYLDGIQSVYFSLTDILNLIAFQTLKISDGYYLIDKYDLHQLSSTAILTTRGQSHTASNKLSANIYGGIYYNPLQVIPDADLALLRQQYQHQTTKLFAQRNVIGDAFPYLENTLYEADGITNLLAGLNIKTTEMIGSEPTELQLRKLSGNSPRILHIATHGFFISNVAQARNIPYFRSVGDLNPMTCSGIVLANGEDTWLGFADADNTDADNILTSAEVSELDLKNTQLVVLSACETGVGGVNAEGVFGLQRGFKQAGVQTICASLWNVADETTAELMQTFYKYWITSGLSLNEAMRQAMLKQRQTTPEPYDWASFIIIDDIY